ncbi:MAG TPA: TonB-dependent receptor [Steroidobacteraceae bacterium]|jgi:outer membrane receptor protein involved in Fe transport|nr:TonB-dependent receptor [Steroidobacteraceae bacterium]
MYEQFHSSERRQAEPGGSALLKSMATLAILAAPQYVMAQDTAQTLAEVVVTGSRLVRSDLSAPSPTTVVNQEAVQLSGDTTVEAAINELPQLSAGNNSSVNSAGGSGVLTANLRGLGAERTLTLVNGRRFIPANGAGSVDLATIPTSLVQRVEIITGGASAVYGSDAIAGAVNFILRDDFEGLEVSTQYGETSESDGKQVQYDALFGSNFDENRGNVTLYASHSTRDPVMMQDREFSRVPLNAALGPSGSGNIPGGRVSLSAAQIAALNVGGGPGVIPTGPEGCTTPVSSIRFGEGGQVLRHCDPETLFNYAAGNYLLRPLDRTQFSGLAHYALGERATAYADVHYALAENEFQQAPDSLAIVTGTNPFFEVPNYATNPVLTPDVRALFVDNPGIFDPDGDGNARIAGGISRRFGETGLRNFAFERSTIGTTVGLRGDFPLGDYTWRWDVFGQYQRSRTDESVHGTMSPARLSLGLNSTTDTAGNVVCVTQVLGCVPVNPFGIGSISPEAAAFISPARSSSDKFERSVAGASLAGEFLKLPAGPISVAIGAEYRDDQYRFLPGATDLAKEYGSASRGITDGGYDVSEAFGEVRVPILSDQPFADVLAVEGAIRYSDYSNFGSVDTWRAGLEWGPVDWLRFRGAYNVAIRAPGINELFAPITEGFSPGNDPCAAVRNPSQAQKDFCVQQGVPADEIDNFVQAALGFAQVSGGNPDLKEETSETWTVGAVLRLPFLDRFNLAVDYYEIEVADAISTINAQTTLDVCYQLLDANSEPCRAITRLPDNGQVFQVRASNSNIGSLSVKGVDLSADYTFGLPDAMSIGGGANMALMLNAGWLFERVSQLVGAAPIDCAGFFGSCTAQGAGGSPDFKALLAASYSSGPLMLRTQVRYIAGLEPLANIAASTPVTAGSVTYVDFATTVQIGDKVELFGGIDNAFDEQPPLLTSSWGGDANTDVTLYDVIGRRYFVGVRARF